MDQLILWSCPSVTRIVNGSTTATRARTLNTTNTIRKRTRTYHQRLKYNESWRSIPIILLQFTHHVIRINMPWDRSKTYRNLRGQPKRELDEADRKAEMATTNSVVEAIGAEQNCLLAAPFYRQWKSPYKLSTKVDRYIGFNQKNGLSK